MQRKLNRIIMSAALSALFGGVMLSAQERVEVATIPFDYHANTKVLPAGTYRVEQLNDRGLFRLSDNSGNGIFVPATQTKEGKANNPRLTFLHYGNDYILSEIWMPGNPTGQAISERSLDRELTRKVGVASLVSVALHSH